MLRRTILVLAAFALAIMFSPAMFADNVTLNAANYVGCAPTPGTCVGSHSTTTDVAGLGLVQFSAWDGDGDFAELLSGTSGTPSYAGVKSPLLDGNTDEISAFPPEMLRIDFLSGSVSVNSISFNNLFTHDDCLFGSIGCITESGQVTAYLAGGGTLILNFSAADTTGLLTLTDPFGTQQVNRLEFVATNAARSDYGLVGLSASVPEPGTLVLLGLGLLGLAGRIRKP